MLQIKFPVKRPAALKDWVSSATPELIERAKKALINNQPNFRGTANFIGVGLRDEDVSVFSGRGCHASMTQVPKNCRHVLATENGARRVEPGYWTRPNIEKPDTSLFLDWFVNHSPFSFIILNRDDPDFCRDYGFILAGDAPTTYVQSACIISRHFYERPYGFVHFNNMVGRGIDPLVAYNIAFNGQTYAYIDQNHMKIYWFIGTGGHSAFPSFNPEVLANVVLGDLKGPLKETYYDKPCIRGTCKLFYSEIDPYAYPNDKSLSLSAYRSVNKEFHEYLLEKEGKLASEEGYRPPNPFDRKAQDSERTKYQFTYFQAVNDVPEFFEQALQKELERRAND